MSTAAVMKARGMPRPMPILAEARRPLDNGLEVEEEAEGDEVEAGIAV